MEPRSCPKGPTDLNPWVQSEQLERMGGSGPPKTNHTERRLHKGTECGSLRKNVSVGAFKFPGEKKASKELFGPFSQSKALVGALESKLT